METAKIVKYIVQEANATEVLEVETWIGESENNKVIFEALEKTWKTSKSLKPQSFDLAKGWERFKINNLEQKPKRFSFIHNYWRYAAAAIIAVGILFGVNYFQNDGHFNAVSFVNQSDSIQKIGLNDGSKISLLRGMLIQDKNWSENNRKVRLKGTAFFKVESNSNSQFTINAGMCQVVVLGTKFLVTANDSIVKVNLMEGKVAFKTPMEELLIEAGQAAIYNIQKNEISISENGMNDFSLIKKQLVFDNIKLADAIIDIEKYYGVKIKIENQKIGNQKINTKFENESLQNVLQILSITLGVEVKELDGYILILEQ